MLGLHKSIDAELKDGNVLHTNGNWIFLLAKFCVEHLVSFKTSERSEFLCVKNMGYKKMLYQLYHLSYK